MVATREQTGSDGPATSTPSSTVPGRHPVVSTSTPEAGANGGRETTQAGGCSKATQVDPAKRSRVLWLPTDEETETDPEDLYSQGDRVLAKIQMGATGGGSSEWNQTFASPREPVRPGPRLP